MLLLKQKFVALLPVLTFLFVERTNGEINFKKGAPQVKLTPDAIASGVLKFSRDGRPFSAFTGIPFATVPERFAESQVVTKPDWNGVKDFVEAGPMCPQMALIPGRKLNDVDDCLNLNVYVPMNNTASNKGYPVMVWIHGGAYLFGEGHGYLPTYFMDEDVLLVTINYRLGVFGFLSTGDDVIPGNNGLKDQVMALKWVKNNIAKFGGDPDKVTIFGESAGATSVHYLLLSPTTKGLFHRAISQSGSALGSWCHQPNPKQVATELAIHLNCSATSSSHEIVSCLRNIPKDQLTIAQFTFKSAWLPGLYTVPFVPVAEALDSKSAQTPFLTKTPVELLLASEKKGGDVFPQVEVPWMAGVIEDDGALFVGPILTDERFVQQMESEWSDRVVETFLLNRLFPTKEEQKLVSEKLKRFYFGDKALSMETAQSFIDLGTDGIFLGGIYKSVKEAVSRGKNKAPIYMYQYTYNGPVSIGGLISNLREEEKRLTGHADELQHQFDLDDSVFPGASGTVKEDTPDAEFSRNFVRLWASFAKHGEPKHSWGTSTSKKWKSVSKKNIDNMPWYRIDSNPKLLDNDPFKERMEFWDELWRDLVVNTGNDGHGNEKLEL